MRLSAVALTGLLLASAPVDAQTPSQRSGAVRIIVRDLTNLPILGAEATLTAPDRSTVRVVTDSSGVARFDDLRPGIHSGRVTSAGFKPFDIGDIPIAPGAVITRDVTLQIEGVFENVEVAAAADARPSVNSLSRHLSTDELDALPEDPDELAEVLAQLVGNDADIRVNGIKTKQLPLGTHISDIRIRYDVGTTSSGGGPRVEIRAVPGGNRWRNDAGVTVRDASLSARNALTGVSPTGRTRQYAWSLNGPIRRQRTGIRLDIDGSKAMDNQAVRAAAPGGILSQLIEQPSNTLGFRTAVDHAVSPAQSIRVTAGGRFNQRRNAGIGEFDLPERGFTSTRSSGEFQLDHHVEVSRFVNDLRLGMTWDSDDASPLSAARTIRVLDAFTSGGAQLSGGRQSRAIEIGHDLEFTVRQHHFTAGVSVAGGRYRGDEYNNRAGTYTFSSVADFEADRPASFTQRIGDPTFAYSMYRAAWSVQDDYRVRHNVLINLGLRQDLQTHLSDRTNLSPAVGVSWTPSASTRTTVRASAAILHTPMDTGIYEQLLLVNGSAQSDLVISHPGFPDPFSAGDTLAAAPASIVRARTSLTMPFARRYTFGIDQPVSRFVQLRATASHQTGHDLFRSRNANAPVDGIRPDQTFGNITELENSARSQNDVLQTDVAIQYPPRRFSANVGYAFGKAMDETDGAFALPPDSADLSREWSPSLLDVRHRLTIGLNTDLVAGFRLAASFRAQSAQPYNVTAGTDPNGDGVFNERPDSFERNSARGAPTKNVDAALTWRLGVGRRPVEDAHRNPGGSRLAAGRDNAPVRFEAFARITNVLNIVNPASFSGVLTSPFFGLPTSTAAARRMVFGTRVWF